MAHRNILFTVHNIRQHVQITAGTMHKLRETQARRHRFLTTSFAVEGVDGSDSEETVLVERVRSERIKLWVEKTSTGNNDFGVDRWTNAHHRHIPVSIDLTAQTPTSLYRSISLNPFIMYSLCLSSCPSRCLSIDNSGSPTDRSALAIGQHASHVGRHSV